MAQCSVCREKNPRERNYCRKCGAEIKVEEWFKTREDRLAGYRALPEGLRKAIERYKPPVAKGSRNRMWLEAKKAYQDEWDDYRCPKCGRYLGDSYYDAHSFTRSGKCTNRECGWDFFPPEQYWKFDSSDKPVPKSKLNQIHDGLEGTIITIVIIIFLLAIFL